MAASPAAAARRLEAAGGRHLDFDADEVTIWTASLSRYFGNWLAGVRGYDSDAGNSFQAHVRRYFGERASYIGVRAGEGREDVRSAADVATLETTEGAVEGMFALDELWRVYGRVGARDGNVALGAAIGRRF